jgi:C4-type Zn-finger protein
LGTSNIDLEEKLKLNKEVRELLNKRCETTDKFSVILRKEGQSISNKRKYEEKKTEKEPTSKKKKNPISALFGKCHNYVSQIAVA